MIHKIIIAPNEILITPSRPVTSFNSKLKKLVDDMIDTMRNAKGVGLAAPQIGISQQIVVIEFEPKKLELNERRIPLTVLINPVITRRSGDKEILKEGCLSIPGVELPILRCCKIKATAQTVDGNPIKVQAAGYLARIIQHEVDHINGVLITNRAKVTSVNRKI